MSRSTGAVVALERPSVADLSVAVICGAAAAALLWGTPAVLAAPLFGVATMFSRRAAVGSAVVVLGLVWLLWAIGVPPDNPAALPATLVCTYALGRYAGALLGWLVVVSWAVSTGVHDRLSPITALFSLALLGAAWTFGRLVRRRTEGAAFAERERGEVASRNPEALAALAVAEERSRLAGESLAVIRAAVMEMQRHTERARRELAERSPRGGAVGDISAAGRRCVSELRVMLGLLRTPDAAPDTTEAMPRRRSVLPLLVLTIALVLVAVLEWSAAGGPLSSLLIAVGVTASPLLAFRSPALGCLSAAAAIAVAIPVQVPGGFGVAEAAAFVVCAWSVGLAGRPSGYATLTGLAVAAGLRVYLLDDPGNLPLTVALLVLPATAGHLWSERERAERADRLETARIEAHQSRVAEDAVRAERLRLARELHDVVSHAVGVMVLQAGAAEALWVRDPASAARALDEVRDAAVRALSELDRLFGLIDAGAVGTPGHASVEEQQPLTESLRALVDRVRATGTRVDLTLDDPLPLDEENGIVVFRIVQEALTNALRYAAGSPIRVRVLSGGQAVEVSVVDEGPGGGGGRGFGLAGLSERVRVVGGTFSAGSRPGGGFEVTARIPCTLAMT